MLLHQVHLYETSMRALSSILSVIASCIVFRSSTQPRSSSTSISLSPCTLQSESHATANKKPPPDFEAMLAPFQIQIQWTTLLAFLATGFANAHCKSTQCSLKPP